MKSHGWQEIEMQAQTPGKVWAQLQESQSKFFGKGPCRVILSHEVPPMGGDKRGHLAISCADRNPTWEEIKDARYSLLPMGLTFAQILPPLSEYINEHPHCFHLWEITWKG